MLSIPALIGSHRSTVSPFGLCLRVFRRSDCVSPVYLPNINTHHPYINSPGYHFEGCVLVTDLSVLTIDLHQVLLLCKINSCDITCMAVQSGCRMGCI